MAAIVLLNIGFFAFLARRKGLVFAAAALPLHLIYYCCCGLSVVIAESFWLLRSRTIDAVRSTAGSAHRPGRAHRFRRRRGLGGLAGFRAWRSAFADRADEPIEIHACGRKPARRTTT